MGQNVSFIYGTKQTKHGKDTDKTRCAIITQHGVTLITQAKEGKSGWDSKKCLHFDDKVTV